MLSSEQCNHVLQRHQSPVYTEGLEEEVHSHYVLSIFPKCVELTIKVRLRVQEVNVVSCMAVSRPVRVHVWDYVHVTSTILSFSHTAPAGLNCVDRLVKL